MLFSDQLLPYTGIIPQHLNDAILEVKHYYKINNCKVLAIDEYCIGVPVVVEVGMPTLGTIGNIDIRKKEPVLIRFNLKLYPDFAPAALSDRPDFPKSKLSHLYASSKDEPAILCLVRGNVHEWFASKRIENFLDVVSEWYYKAANGKLNDDGDEFDPLRLEGYTGYHSYRYNKVKSIIDENISFLPKHSFACLISISYNHNEDNNSTSFKSELSVQAANIDIVLKTFQKINSTTPDKLKIVPITSILIWHSEQKIFEEYESEMPKNYKSLKIYFEKYGTDIDSILITLIKNNFISTEFVPIIHAIKRPKKMIGFEGFYELTNFLIYVKANKRGKIDDSCRVRNQSHIEPFSKDLSKALTEENRDNSTLFIGSGSLGSKIIMHDVRAGKTSIGICDSDHFLEHNLVRHVLFTENVGKNKAEAMVEQIKKMLETEPSKTLNAYPIPVSLLTDYQISLYNWIVDSTASQNVLNWLVKKKFAENTILARCELVDKGNVGLLYIEGENRNPRIDDLINLAYYRSLNNKNLAKWRVNDLNSKPDTLNIGLGCSSISTVMADDTISEHAAVFSRLLFNENDRKNIKDKGLLFINSLTIIGIPQTETKAEFVSPFDIYLCKADSGWELRLMHGLQERLLMQCRKHKPKETGGILIGICNYKTKSIHVYDFLQAPPDSISSSSYFIRGISGLVQKVDVIKNNTGGLIGYVGEWHTHPMQLESLSERDIQTINDLKPINQNIPIPTLSLIVTNTGLLPYIFN